METIIKKMQERGVIVYGGGRIGKQIIKELQTHHIPILCVWDRNAEKIGNVEKIQLPKDQEVEKETFIIICLFSKKVSEQIKEELKEKGFLNVFYSDAKELSILHCEFEKKEFDLRQCNRCVLSTGGCREYQEKLKKEKETYLHLDTLSLSPTAKCTLNCRNCAQMTGEYQKKKKGIDWEVPIFEKVWKRVEQVFGWIKEVRFGGGELFLHKDWKALIAICQKSEWVGSIGIITNGIYRLSEEDYRFLSHPKIIVLLDDYTSKLESNQKKIWEETKQSFFNYNVNFVVLDNTEGTWYQFGKFEKNLLEERDLKHLYQECTVNRCFMLTMDYCFSICGRATVAKDLGYVNTTKEDCVSLYHEEEIETVREKIKALMEREYLEICRYCNGSNQIIPAGEQNERLAITKRRRYEGL